MNDIQPIKRSRQLQPLSREHHDGLLAVWKIRQGLNNHTSIEKLQKYVGWFWKNHIKPHFFQEEEILLAHLPALHPLGIKMKNEHTEIRELMLVIDKDVDQYDLVSLANLIESHIRWEEREFFNYLDLNLSAKELDDIHEKLNTHSVNCVDTWKDEFWVNS